MLCRSLNIAWIVTHEACWPGYCVAAEVLYHVSPCSGRASLQVAVMCWTPFA